MSLAVWLMMGVALWHFAVFVPDRFYGGIIGALVAAMVGATVSGFAAAGFDVSNENPPGLAHFFAAVPGGILGLLVSFLVGSRIEPETDFKF
jgi:uncharacterized membrane protein YeaQ/YmgE (transglycosylase-associated protein family)